MKRNIFMLGLFFSLSAISNTAELETPDSVSLKLKNIAKAGIKYEDFSKKELPYSIEKLGETNLDSGKLAEYEVYDVGFGSNQEVKDVLSLIKRDEVEEKTNTEVIFELKKLKDYALKFQKELLKFELADDKNRVALDNINKSYYKDLVETVIDGKAGASEHNSHNNSPANKLGSFYSFEQYKDIILKKYENHKKHLEYLKKIKNVDIYDLEKAKIDLKEAEKNLKKFENKYAEISKETGVSITLNDFNEAIKDESKLEKLNKKLASKEINDYIKIKKSELDNIKKIANINILDVDNQNDFEQQFTVEPASEEITDLIDADLKSLKKANNVQNNRQNIAILENNLKINGNTKEIQKNRVTIQNLEKKTSSGIASVAAMSMVDMPHKNAGDINIGAGIGGFDNTQAVAVGIGYAPTNNFNIAVKMALNPAESKYTTYGAGFNYNFNINK